MTTVPAALPPILPGLAGSSRRRWMVLHGWAQGPAFWAPLARRLAGDGIALLCPDLPAIADQCRAAAGTLERLREIAGRLAESGAHDGVSAIVAHSAGATVGVLSAGQLPVDALVLVEPLAHQLGLADPPAVPKAPAMPADAGEPGGGGLRQWYPFAAPETLRTIASALGRGGAIAGGIGRLSSDPDRAKALCAALAVLPVPLVLLRGERSALLSTEDANRIVAMAPRGSAQVIAGAGHSVHVDQPRVLAEVLVRCVSDKSDARPAGW